MSSQVKIRLNLSLVRLKSASKISMDIIVKFKGIFGECLKHLGVVVHLTSVANINYFTLLQKKLPF